MEKYRKTEILQIVEEEGVEFIRLQFTDMFGTLKNVAVPVSCLEKAMDDRCTIDLASLNGFAKEEETELYLKPDFSTFTILPWRPQNGKVARFLCDVCTEDGSEYELSPRLILKPRIKLTVIFPFCYSTILTGTNRITLGLPIAHNNVTDTT